MPCLTCILVCPTDLENVALTLRHLSLQTVADQLEVLLPCPVPMTIPSKISENFEACRVIVVPGPARRGLMAAEAVRQASASLVVCVENHAFPNPDWAQQLVAGHRNDCVGVSPAVLLYNTSNLLARVCHRLDFGHLRAEAPEFVEWTPWHNTSYRREALLSFGKELGELLELESHLQSRLLAQGEKLLLYPDAKILHTANSTWRTVLKTYFCHGRCFAADRCKEWPTWWRLLYAALSPAFVILMLRAVWSKFENLETLPRLLYLFHVLIFSAARAAGEAVGFVSGRGEAWDFVVLHEFFLEHRVSRRQRESMEALARNYLAEVREPEEARR